MKPADARVGRAAVFAGVPDKIELREYAVAPLQPGEILVRVAACTLCGSDLHSFHGRRAVPVPTVLGHEIVGEIVELDAAAEPRDLAGEPLRVGDRVVWALVAHCGQCFYCQRGLPQKCLHAVKYGHEAIRPGREFLGGLADVCQLVPGTSIVRLPQELPLEAAAPASCATATVAAALDAAGGIRGRTVCVVGAGMLGLTACAMAHARGAAAILCLDPQPARRALALRFGAGRAIAPDELADAARDIAGPLGFDVVLEFSGSPAAFLAIWPCLRIGGVLVLVGAVFPGPAVELRMEEVVRRQLTIRGVHNYAPAHLGEGVEFLAAEHAKYPFAELVAQWYPLEAIAEAFRCAAEPSVIRIGVRP
ncbi:MAG: zinc-binding dehydrogenase [Planctomycetaceae bacterium]|nr:zinc-binding dehydrogenase [Planctomycetaceae bacterium]